MTPSAAWLSLSQAIQCAVDSLHPVSQTTRLSLQQALGAVTANTINAVIDVPTYTNSAMDGYALNSTDTLSTQVFTIAQTILAGDVSKHTLKSGECARIMTGAPLPLGADAVVMQENAQREGNTVSITQNPIKSGTAVRVQGCDVSADQELIPAGTRLTAAHLMLLASQGMAEVEVIAPLRVGVLTTGDELQAPGKPLKSGQLYDCNRTGIIAQLKTLSIEAVDFGCCPDDSIALSNAFSNAADCVDVLITAGGVSVGDADLVKPIIESLGNIDFWRVAIKPGKPFAMGRINKTVILGVPGNPVSAYVTTEQIVFPILRYLQGERFDLLHSHLQIKALMTESFSRSGGREEFVRARAHCNENGEWFCTPLPRQSSAIMTTVTQANCYLRMAPDQTELAEGQSVVIQPFSRLHDYTSSTHVD